MKVDVKAVPEMTLEQFADEHELTLQVTERGSETLKLPCVRHRWHAGFKGVEVKQRSCLMSIYGNGSTKEDAIDDYRQQLSEKSVVVDAYSSKRRDIEVPRLVEATDDAR